MKAGNVSYNSLNDLPQSVPLFPLSGALLLPSGNMPLNLFEPRYLAMFDHALRGDRLIGMIQPRFDIEQDKSSLNEPQLCEIGCIGRITAFQESGDDRIIINLAGVTRFRIVEEIEGRDGYRIANVAGFSGDLEDGSEAAEAVNRDALLTTFKQFLEANEMEADWDGVREADTETLVNTLCMMSPYGAPEKQALLEAPDLKTRAETLIAITEMLLAREVGNSTSTLQ